MDRSDDNLNNKNKSKNFLKKHVNSIFFLVLLTTIVSMITYYRILVQIEMGPVSDSIIFLVNALVYAGQGTGYSDLLFPPFFSFITSLIFRIGYVTSTTIFAVDGGLFVFGVIGLYLLLKIRFNDLESFLGGLLYSTFPIVLTILGLGLSDLSSVSFSIWTIYFLILAVKKDSRFFYLTFPFAMLSFLTRYNSALLIFPIFLYILMNKEKINLKNIIIGIVASILTILPVLIFYYETFGNMIYPFISFGSTSMMVSFSTENPYYDPNIFFFLQKFPAFVGVQGSIILLLAALAVVLLILKFVQKIRENINSDDGSSLNDRAKNIKWIFFVLLGVIFLGSFGKTFYIISELLFFVVAYLFYDLTKNMKRDMDIHILFLVWFMAFFIFHSILIIKDNRYFVVMAPPVAYFMILGLKEISNRIKFKVRKRNISSPLIAIFLTSIMLLSAAYNIPLILQSNNSNIIFNEQLELASEWFVNYDPNYKNKNIYSDLWPNFSWYLKTNVKKVPFFKDNYTFNPEDSSSLNHFLESNNDDYYFSSYQGLNLESYIKIKEFGYVSIYKRKI